MEPVSTSYESFDAGDFGFIEHYGEEISVQHDEQLPVQLVFTHIISFY